MKLGFLFPILFQLISVSCNKQPAFDLPTSGNLKIALHSGFGGRSHIKPILEIGQVLHKRGHEVTYIALEDNMPFMSGYTFNNYTLGPAMMTSEEIRDIMSLNLSNKKREFDPMRRISTSLIPVVERSYSTLYQPLIKYLKEHKPDMIVCDFASHPCLDASRSLGIPLIIGLQTTDIMGFVTAPYITKSMGYGPIYTDKMSFFERFYNLIIEQVLEMRYLLPFNRKINKIKQKYNLPKGKDVFGNLNYGLIVANTFVGFEPAVPTTPNIYQLGPIISENKQILSKDFEDFLNSHQKVLFIAFGSNSVLDAILAKKLLEASIQAIDHGFIDGIIWGLGRTKQEDFPTHITINSKQIETKSIFNNEYSNIKLMPWTPQVPILEHKNTKLFISHGGSESTFESLLAGTPILCLALFGDQFRNGRKIEEMGVGQFVDLDTFTPQSLLDQIEAVIEDKDNQIQSNIIRMKTIVHHNSKKKNSAADLFEQHAYTAKACRLFEPYVSSDGKLPCEIRHLIPISEEMGVIKANGIDLYFVTLLLILASLYSLSCFVSYLLSFAATKNSMDNRLKED